MAATPNISKSTNPPELTSFTPPNSPRTTSKFSQKQTPLVEKEITREAFRKAMSFQGAGPVSNATALFYAITGRCFVPATGQSPTARQSLDQAMVDFLETAYTICAGAKNSKGNRVPFAEEKLKPEFEKLNKNLKDLLAKIKTIPQKESSDSISFIVSECMRLISDNKKNASLNNLAKPIGKEFLFGFFKNVVSNTQNKSAEEITDTDITFDTSVLKADLPEKPIDNTNSEPKPRVTQIPSSRCRKITSFAGKALLVIGVGAGLTALGYAAYTFAGPLLASMTPLLAASRNPGNSTGLTNDTYRNSSSPAWQLPTTSWNPHSTGTFVDDSQYVSFPRSRSV